VILKQRTRPRSRINFISYRSNFDYDHSNWGRGGVAFVGTERGTVITCGRVYLLTLVELVCHPCGYKLRTGPRNLKLKTGIENKERNRKGKLSAVNEQSPIQALQKNIAHKNSN
jgi:hypothetical protein